MSDDPDRDDLPSGADPDASAEDEPELSPEEQKERDEKRRAEERGYLRVSRSLSASLLSLLPLLAVYELGILTDVSAAAAWIKTPIFWLRAHPVELLGTDLTAILNGVFIVAILVAVWWLGRLGALHGRTFLAMFTESVFYALLIGPAALFPLIRRWEFAEFSPNLANFWPKVVASCGAGVYEEIVFRFLLLGVIYFIAKERGKLHAVTAGLLALFVSGVIFSIAHFLSEDPDYTAFMYRLMVGIIFGIIYLTRGLGIAAWTHALYDVYVLCFVVQQ